MENEKKKNRVELLGFGIDKFDFDGAINFALDLIKTKKGGQIVTINPEMIENGLKNPEFAETLNSADLVIPDGVGVKIGLILKGINIQRIAGIEFSHKLIEECATNKFPIALIGAKPHIIYQAQENLQAEFPDLKITYFQNGYFSDKQRVLAELKEKSPKLILVALGSPKQEDFIKEARLLLPQSLMIGVGGSFDVWSGNVERAPIAFQKLGLEWLYRTIKEPKRIKRIFPTLPRFILRVMFSKSN